MLGFALLCGLVLQDTPSAPREAYEALKKETPRDAVSQVQLALWCEKNGLTTERAKHLAMATLADPENVLARSLLGLIKDGDDWRKPEDIQKNNPARDEYRRRRETAKNTADEQTKLAAWCERNGLDEEAQAHWRAVVRLDPKREHAWKALGCRKVSGRWLTDAQVAAEKAEAALQREADRHWLAALDSWKDELRSKRDEVRAEAERNLGEVTEPRAVPAVILVFFVRKDPNKRRGVQLLGQIDDPRASRALAFLALHDESGELRGMAGRALATRDPREYAGVLVQAFQDPIRYEVRPVGGPGSPGALFVEGKQVNLVRTYSPPPGPVILPTDRLGYDANGQLMAERRVGSYWEHHKALDLLVDEYVPTPKRVANVLHSPVGRAASAALLGQAGPGFSPQVLGTGLMELMAPPMTDVRMFALMSNEVSAFHNMSSLSLERELLMTVPLGRMAEEAQRAALASQEQLRQDIACLERYNTCVREMNERSRPLLQVASGVEKAGSRTEWFAWWVDQIGYAPPSKIDQPRTTVVEDLLPNYVPQQDLSTPLYGGRLLSYFRMSCFAAGTMVQTLDGPRPIESLQVGDRVLAQKTATAELVYEPVLVVHRNPPSRTFAVKAGGETIVASTFHRFWVAGRGWVMARDLKAGDPIRTLRGTASVESIEDGEVVPVFNLDVAEAATFFVGDTALLVHDNTLPDFRAEPYDRLAGPFVAVTSR